MENDKWKMANVRAIGFSPIFLLPFAICHITLADTIWIASGTGKELEIPNVRIGDVQDSKLSFETPAGRQGQRDLAQISRLAIDDEPALAAAEQAYIEHRW